MTCYYIKVEVCYSDQKLDENEFIKRDFLSYSSVEAIMNFPETSIMMKHAWEKYKKIIRGEQL